MERALGCNQSKWLWHSFVCSVAPEDDQLPLVLSFWCSIDLPLIFFFVRARSKLYSKSKLLYFFFDFWSDFWYPRKGHCLLFVNVVIIIIVGAMRFIFKAINYLLQCFSIMSIFAKYISQMFYFPPQIFFRKDFCSSRKKSFEYAGNCVA